MKLAQLKEATDKLIDSSIYRYGDASSGPLRRTCGVLSLPPTPGGQSGRQRLRPRRAQLHCCIGSFVFSSHIAPHCASDDMVQ